MKEKIRSRIRKRLGSLDRSAALAKSAMIKEKLFREEAFRKAKCVMFYVSKETEVDTSEMIDETLRMGKRVCVPLVSKGDKLMGASEIQDRSRDLEPGCFGIFQPKKGRFRPVPLEDIDLVVVPGVAFDKRNVRLGHGHGYYDTFLGLLPDSAETIGLAFDLQVVKKLPSHPHDIPVDKVITA